METDEIKKINPEEINGLAESLLAQHRKGELSDMEVHSRLKDLYNQYLWHSDELDGYKSPSPSETATQVLYTLIDIAARHNNQAELVGEFGVLIGKLQQDESKKNYASNLEAYLKSKKQENSGLGKLRQSFINRLHLWKKQIGMTEWEQKHGSRD